MNAERLRNIGAGTPGGACGAELIGIAVVFPGLSNAGLAGLLEVLVEGWLRDEGIEAAGVGGIFGRSYAAFTFEVAERNRAARVLQGRAPELRTFHKVEIAFWDRAEGYWRTVHPEGCSEPFARFLAAERVQDCREFIKSDNEAALAAIARGKGEV